MELHLLVFIIFAFKNRKLKWKAIIITDHLNGEFLANIFMLFNKKKYLSTHRYYLFDRFRDTQVSVINFKACTGKLHSNLRIQMNERVGFLSYVFNLLNRLSAVFIHWSNTSIRLQHFVRQIYNNNNNINNK